MPIRVVTKRKNAPRAFKIQPGEGLISCDRETAVGNPFVIGKDGTREEVIEKFDVYIRSRIERWRYAVELAQALPAQRNPDLEPDDVFVGGWFRHVIARVKNGEYIALACWCAPLKCHGDILKRIVEDAINGRLSAFQYRGGSERAREGSGLQVSRAILRQDE